MRSYQKSNAQIGGVWGLFDIVKVVNDGSLRIVKKDKNVEIKINALEDEQDEIKQLIAQLEKERYATNK